MLWPLYLLQGKKFLSCNCTSIPWTMHLRRNRKSCLKEKQPNWLLMPTTIKLLIMQPILRLWETVSSFCALVIKAITETYKWPGAGKQLLPYKQRTITATKISYTSNDAQATAASFLFIPSPSLLATRCNLQFETLPSNSYSQTNNTNSLSTTNNRRMRSSLLKPKFFTVS